MGAFGEQELGGFQAHAQGGEERRDAGEGPGIGIGARFQKKLDDGRAGGLHGGQVKSRAAFHCLGIDVGALRKQQLQFGGVGDRPMQSGGFAIVMRIGIGPGGQQLAHHFQIAGIGGVHQRGGAGSVGRLRERFVGGQRLADGRQVLAVDGIEERLNLGVGGLLLFAHGPIGAARHVGALVDPGAQDADVFGRQRTGGRHLQAGVGTGQAQDQLALGAVAGNDDSSVVAAAERVLAQIETQAGLLLCLPSDSRNTWPRGWACTCWL